MMRLNPILLALICLSGCSVLQPHDAPIKAPDIFTVADADKVLDAAARDRARAEAVHAQAELVCYQKFFVNSCLDDAREVRRTALAPVRAAEVAAARFKREAAVAQRDRELAEAEAVHEAQLKQAQVDEEAEARKRAEQAASEAPATAVAPAVKEKKPGMTVEQRAARRDEREKKAEAKLKERVARHADNVAEQEARRKESEERVRRVEEKKKAKAASKSSSD